MLHHEYRARYRERPMRPFRRQLAALLAVALPLGALACGGDDGGEAAAGTAGDASGGASLTGAEIPPGIPLRVEKQSPVGELSIALSGLNDDLPYEIEYVRFNSGPLTNEGFAAGALQNGSVGGHPAIGAGGRDP